MDFSSILTSIGIGLLATTSPCVFPLYPGYLAYISASQDVGGAEKASQNRYFLGFFCSVWCANHDVVSESDYFSAIFINWECAVCRNSICVPDSYFPRCFINPG